MAGRMPLLDAVLAQLAEQCFCKAQVVGSIPTDGFCMSMADSHQQFVPVVVTPTYNNDRTLGDVLERIAGLGLPIIVVNDGCNDTTASVLEAWKASHPDYHLEVCVHSQNRGKAAALKTGFARAAALNFTHAITIDTDGQHDPEEIPVLLEAARRSPLAYVLGFRDDTRPDYPAKSRIGRRISNFFIRVESGLRVRDSQCGMRIYPLKLISTVPCRAGFFGYEAEIITRAAWSGCPIAEVPIVTRYLPPGQRVSHFRPWLDTFRGIAVHLRLLGRALIPWPHPKYQSVEARGNREPILRSIWRWINPLRAWRELRGGQLEPMEVSAAIAVGVFIGNLPAYGVQTVLALYAARRLHLEPVAVVAGSHVSIPPVAPFLIAGAIGIGHLVLHGAWPGTALLHVHWSTLAASVLLDWLVGGVILGLVLGVLAFIASQAAFRLSGLLEPTRNSAPNQMNPDTPSAPSAHPAEQASGPAAAGRSPAA